MQTIGIIAYRTFTLTMLFLIFNNGIIYNFIFSLIIGLLSEYKNITYKKEKEKEYLIIDAGKWVEGVQKFMIDDDEIQSGQYRGESNLFRRTAKCTFPPM